METGPNAILNHPIALEETFSHKDSGETEEDTYRVLETIRRIRKLHPNLKVA